MIDFDKIFDEIVDLLKSNLPAHLVYHNLDHTKYVLDKSILIADQECINGHELSLIKIAALYHDIGFIKSRENHEEIGCDIAQDNLTIYGLSEDDIQRICGMIMATKIPQKPYTLLEKIMADADLEYLGTANFEDISERLYEELLYFNPKLSRIEWFKIQADFLSAHRYHTAFCKEFREDIKLKNLENVNQKLRMLSLDFK